MPHIQTIARPTLLTQASALSERTRLFHQNVRRRLITGVRFEVELRQLQDELAALQTRA